MENVHDSRVNCHMGAFYISQSVLYSIGPLLCVGLPTTVSRTRSRTPQARPTVYEIHTKTASPIRAKFEIVATGFKWIPSRASRYSHLSKENLGLTRRIQINPDMIKALT